MGDMVPMTGDKDEVPAHLCICLTKPELDALGLDYGADIGDYIHFTGLGRVTSVTKSEASEMHVEFGDAKEVGEPMVRIEVEIVALGLEDESHEDVDEEAGEALSGALYGAG